MVIDGHMRGSRNMVIRTAASVLSLPRIILEANGSDSLDEVVLRESIYEAQFRTRRVGECRRLQQCIKRTLGTQQWPNFNRQVCGTAEATSSVRRLPLVPLRTRER